MTSSGSVKRLTCQTFDGSYQDYLDRSGLLDEGRLTRGFRWIHQASKPCLIAYYKGPFKLFVAVHKEPPSNFVSCAQWVPMFELCVATRLSLAPWVWSSQALLWHDSRFNGQIGRHFISRSPLVTKKYLGRTAEALLVARMPVYYIDHNIYIVIICT